MGRRTAFVLIVAGGLALSSNPQVMAESFSVPVSNRVIVGELSLPNSTTAEFEAREGTMVRVDAVEAGYSYAFIPIIDPRTNQTRFTIFEISDLESGKEGVVEVASATDGSGLDFGGQRFSLRVHEVERREFAVSAQAKNEGLHARELKKLYGHNEGLCSVTCRALKVSAGSVRMDCGSCIAEGFSQ